MRRSAGIWWVALALAAGIVGLLLLDNRQYLFHAELHESSDWASDSLFVRDAKSGVLLHGHYSRWNFYHPGPALFYVLTLGEAVFYDLLRVVPTPYNGQVIAVCAAVTLFFSLALSVFARRLGPERGGYTFFLPLALLFGIWHYGAAENVHAFLETWPVCPPILIFLCFLVAAASTASGGGRELPLLAVTGGWLVHNYIAQPLFVVPLTLLAYAGLLAACRRLPGGAEGGNKRRGGLGGALTAGWRAFPRAHVFAGVMLALFILPVLIDALRGSESNLSRILTHLRQQHEPPKKLMRSLCYFLTFGGYVSYDPAQNYFGRYSAAGMFSFAALHWRAYLCWIVALLAPPILFAVSRRRPAAAAGTPEADGTQPPPRSTFIPWFYVVVTIAVALTLAWGMKQDGNMYYFNAYFNYSLYYCAALGLAAALAVFLQWLTAAPGLARGRTVICAALWLGALTAAFDGAAHFQYHALDFPADRAAAQVVVQAAAATLPPGAICVLDCDPWDAWPAMIGVALQLDRLGYKVRVNDNWGTMFGMKRTFVHEQVDLSKPIVRWRIVPTARNPAQLSRWPVLMACGIQVSEIADLPPTASRIQFTGGGNYTDYVYFGWAPAGDGWTWADQRNALMQFRPFPLPPESADGVDLLINGWSFASPTQPTPQRVEIQFNGVALETVRLPVAPPPPDQYSARAHISAEAWRDAVAHGLAKVLFRFPDAKSPYEVGINDDVRRLGGGFRSVEFRPTPPTKTPETP